MRVREGNKVGACTGALCRGEKIYLGLPFPLPLYLLRQRNSPCYASPSFLPALLPFIESAAPSVSPKANPLILESPPPHLPVSQDIPASANNPLAARTRPHTSSPITHMNSAFLPRTSSYTLFALLLPTLFMCSDFPLRLLRMRRFLMTALARSGEGRSDRTRPAMMSLAPRIKG